MFSFRQTKDWIILIIIALLVVGVSIFLRYRTTGKWVCKDNLWVAEGNPESARPGLYCK